MVREARGRRACGALFAERGLVGRRLYTHPTVCSVHLVETGDGRGGSGG